MDLEGIMPSEVRQRKKNTVWYHLYVESTDDNKLVNITEKKQTHRHREQTCGCQGGGGSGRGWIGSLGLADANCYI